MPHHGMKAPILITLLLTILIQQLPGFNLANKIIASGASSQPDLTIILVTWLPLSIKQGDQVTFTVKVRNRGDAASPECQLALQIGGSSVVNVTLPSLSAGETKDVVVSWTPQQAGSLNLKFKADSLNTVAESDESNNEMVANVKVAASGECDLVAEGMTWEPKEPALSKPVTLTPKIRNAGEAPSPSCLIRFKVNDVTLGSITIPSIPPGAELRTVKNVSQMWTPISLGAQKVRLEIDPENEVKEKSESNNYVEATLIVYLPDTSPPVVTVTHTPANPTEGDTVTFQATATDSGGVKSITIFVNGNPVKTSTNATTCTYTGGPYPRGSTVNYMAESQDNNGNIAQIQLKSFTVSSTQQGIPGYPVIAAIIGLIATIALLRILRTRV